MAEILFGGETEYAVAGLPPGGGEPQSEEIAMALMEQARSRLIHLPDIQSSGGMYLANSSRFYLDCRVHPELATPECMNPWDAVRYVEAGHAILSSLAEAVQTECAVGTEIMLLRTNVDLGGSQSTWGCHESYSHRGSQSGLRAHLIPHLVTRIIYTGAGGFDPFAHGLAFMLSPRAAHIRSVVTENSTSQRGLWDTKSESLSAKSHRLHVICGESECSHTAMWLKFGVTALIVAMADSGLEPGNMVQLADPVGALQAIARDGSCTARLPLSDGRSLTAIEIQRQYLCQARANQAHPCMPPWAGEVCSRWGAILDRLESDTSLVDKTLDWAIKLKLYARHAQQRGIRWESLPILNQLIEKCAARVPQTAHAESGMPLLRALESPRILQELAPVESKLSASGLGWDHLRALLQMRDEFFEIETRFSQLGPKGIFARLHQSGVLDHGVAGVDNIEYAMEHPPLRGRANLRGQVVRRLGAEHQAHCEWHRVVDRGRSMVLDMSDPFSQEEMWKPLTGFELRHMGMLSVPEELYFALPDEDNGIPASIRRQQAYDRYEQGEYAQAETLLRSCLDEGFEEPGTRCHLARTLMMLDREVEARDEIRRAWEVRFSGPVYVLARILWFQCLFAILDRSDSSDYVRQFKQALQDPGAHMDWTTRPLLAHIRSRLGPGDFQFICALAAAASSDDGVRRLARYAQWRAIDLSAIVN
jgi:hypothetical protein